MQHVCANMLYKAKMLGFSRIRLKRRINRKLYTCVARDHFRGPERRLGLGLSSGAEQNRQRRERITAAINGCHFLTVLTGLARLTIPLAALAPG